MPKSKIKTLKDFLKAAPKAEIEEHLDEEDRSKGNWHVCKPGEGAWL